MRYVKVMGKMVSHLFFFLNVKMHLECKHPKGMSQEMTLGNLR